MKTIITTVGLLAVGNAGLQAAEYAPAPELSRVQTSKPWSISASLRGFYDDNYTTSPSSLREETFGYEVSPSVALNLTREQTYLGLSYLYSMKYFEERDRKMDHMHQANVKLSHAFTPRYKIDVSDSFVIAQEPEILDPNTAFRLRAEGDNVRNTAAATFTGDLTDQLGIVVGYSNNLYDYEDARYSALLDRLEHLATLNLRWQFLPQTVGILGYQYGVTEYTDNGVIVGPPTVPVAIKSDFRDTTTHYAYVGVDQSFTPQLNGSIRLGAQFTDYDNANDDTVSPYADGNLTWTYRPGSYAQLGVRHTRTATDVSFLAGVPNLDQEVTTVYSSINHKLTAKITGSLLAQYQHASFEDTPGDESENFLLAGLNFSYEINKFLTAETGYNYDRLSSEISNRSFTRNRVYVGLRATY